MASKVYFTDMHTENGESLLKKLERLIDRTGLGKIDFRNKFVAIKLHFGEPGNLAYLRPNYAKVVADYVRARGGIPFLTDCNTLYAGRRKHAVEHIESAYENGYNPLTTGCQVLIADGLRGTDDEGVAIDGELVKTAWIGKAIVDADVLISLTHFKGHCEAGFGGAIKNIGMGCGSRAGKMDMHSKGKPYVDEERCVGCKRCIRNCGANAIDYTADHKAKIDADRCVGCGRCIGLCNADAIVPMCDEILDNLNRKMAEYTLAACKDKEHFHISFAVDISPECDCFGTNDTPIAPDIGMFASFDPVAIDKACMDAVNEQTGCTCQENDLFQKVHPGTDAIVQLTHGEKIGLGSVKYERIDI